MITKTIDIKKCLKGYKGSTHLYNGIQTKIQHPLFKLYQETLSSEYAQDVYIAYDTYVDSLMEDVKKSLMEIGNLDMEYSFIARLPLIEEKIQLLKEAIEVQVTAFY